MIIPYTFLHKVLVPHAAFDEGLERLEYFFDPDLGELVEPEIIAVVGKTGTGKSRLLETLRDRHAAARFLEGIKRPVVMASVPSRPTIKGVGDLILKCLDPNDVRRYTENEMSRRIKTLMKNCDTRMLILEEFQHFFDKTSKKVWHHVTDWLKLLVDDVGCVLVVSGLEEGLAVIHQSPQLKGRCRLKIVLPQFLWNNDAHKAQFIAILGGFHDAVAAKSFGLPNLRDEEWAFRCYCASGGLLRYVKKLLSEVMIGASLKRQHSALTLKEFAEAYERSIGAFEDEQYGVAPFDPDLSFVWTPQLAVRVEKMAEYAQQEA
jgi:Bacterial TniB protein